MSNSWLTARVGCCAAALTLGTLSCGAQVRIPDDDEDAGSGGATSAVGGAPTTSAAGGSSTGGSGGGEPEADAEALVKAQCPEVGAEAHFCVTLSSPDNTLYAVSPDSGSLCYLGTIGGLEGGGVSSIAVVGPNVHGCSHNLGVWRAPVLGGPAEVLPMECGALTGYQGGFLLSGLTSQNTLRHYASFESLGSGSALQSFDLDTDHSKTVRQDTLFTAWSSGDKIQLNDLPSSTPLPDLYLEGFYEWIDGISATSDSRLYLLSNGNIFAFDVATGEPLQQTYIPTESNSLSTLHCWTN
jgi:hypothetical protein